MSVGIGIGIAITATNNIGAGSVRPTPSFSNTKSVLFDGVDDFVNCGNVTTLNNATNGSWSLWIKPQATGLKFLFKEISQLY